MNSSQRLNSGLGSQYLHVLHKILFDNAGPLAVLLTSSIASTLIFPGATLPLLTATFAFFATKVVLQLSPDLLKQHANQVYNMNEKHPLYKVIFPIASVALALLSPTLSLLASCSSGIYLGLTPLGRKIRTADPTSSNALSQVL